MRRKLVLLGIALALAIPAASMAGGSDPAVRQSSGTMAQQATPTIRQTTVLSGGHAIVKLAVYTLLPHHYAWFKGVCPTSRPLAINGAFQASSVYVFVSSSYSSGSTWWMRFSNPGNTSSTLRMQFLCYPF